MLNLRSLSLLVASSLITLAGSSLLAQSFTFGAPRSIALPSSALGDPVGLDMNGDGNTDVYIQLKTGDYVYLADGKGNLSSTPIKVYESATGFLFSPVFYDVNGDGFADEIYYYPGYYDQYPGESYNGVFAVLLGDGKGNFSETTNLPLNTFGTSQGGLVAGDFNNDGKLDFATISEADNFFGYVPEIDVFLNTGGGHYQFGFQELLESSGGLVRGDFNGDGNQDLVWTETDQEGAAPNQYSIHCLYGNGDGTFRADEVCYNIDGRPSSVAAADFNRDGKTDLIVYTDAKQDAQGHTEPGAQPRLATLFARSGGGFSWSSSVLPPSGYPGQLQIAEMNADGKPDIIYNSYYIFKSNGDGFFAAGQQAPDTNIFIPLVKGGLPDSIDLTSDITGAYIVYRLNTSKP